jgi:hypothetical protein
MSAGLIYSAYFLENSECYISESLGCCKAR